MHILSLLRSYSDAHIAHWHFQGCNRNRLNHKANVKEGMWVLVCLLTHLSTRTSSSLKVHREGWVCAIPWLDLGLMYNLYTAMARYVDIYTLFDIFGPTPAGDVHIFLSFPWGVVSSTNCPSHHTCCLPPNTTADYSHVSGVHFIK